MGETKLSPYQSFDLAEQAVDALHVTSEFLGRVVDDPFAWKWVVIALHNALHGFMGLALRSSHGAQLLSKKHERRTYELWEKERQLGQPIGRPTEVRVDEFLNLYEKVKDPARMGQFVYSHVFVATPEQDKSVDYLNWLRNQFSHYSATTLVVGVEALPQVMTDCLDVIKFLVNESGNVLLYPWDLESRTTTVLAALESQVTLLVAQSSAGSSKASSP